MLRRTLAAAGGLTAGYIAYRLSSEDGKQSLLLDLARTDAAIRPQLAAVLPHDAFVALYSASRTPFLQTLSSCSGGHGISSDSSAVASSMVQVMGLSFRNDLGNAAGLDKDASLLDLNYALGAGFAVVGTVLSESHTGNVFSFFGGLWSGNVWTPLPISGAALNSLGLPSKGVDVAVANIAAFRDRHGLPPQTPAPEARGGGGNSGSVDPTKAFPIGVSIMGHPAHASDAAKKLEGVLACVRTALPQADFIEVNESCPNVKHGSGSSGGHGAGDADLTARCKAIVRVRDEYARAPGGRRVPVLVKLGDLGDSPHATVRLLAKAGVDGVIALNTQKDYEAFSLPEADRRLLEHYTSRYSGGLSGPPILDRSTRQVLEAQRAVSALRLEGKFTVVHVGGIQSAADVQRSRATGAELRQWYTGLMHGLADADPLGLYRRVTASTRA